MKILSVIISGLFLSSCSSIQKLRTPDYAFKHNSCFVRWLNPEIKEKFIKSHGLSRSERSAQNLLFPIVPEQAFSVIEVEDSYVTVSPWQFGLMSSAPQFENFRNMVKKYLVLDEESDSQLRKLYYLGQRKINKKWLSAHIQEASYEEVDCQDLENSLYL